MHVSRYWSSYKTDYVSKYGDNEVTFHIAFGSDYSLEKLQLEYDQFFIRASQQILSANRYDDRIHPPFYRELLVVIIFIFQAWRVAVSYRYAVL